ncbi:AraC family transcriptional regulator [Cohnella endophytica]|nr:helix-turn-helix domain-containing protein [Cohnella endophytica]
MPISKLRKNGQLYIKLLMSITICTVFTLILSSSIYYISYSRTLQKQVYQTDLANLRQTSREVVSMTDIAQSLSFQIYRNSSIAKLLFYKDPSIFDIRAVMMDLDVYISSMPYIQSIYVYNPNASTFYISSARGQGGILTEDELDDRSIIDVLDHFEDYNAFTPIARKYKVTPDDPTETGIYTYLCYDAIGQDRKINSAVIINLSSSWINRGMSSSNNGTGKSFILNDKGTVLSGEDLTPQPWDSGQLKQLKSRVQGNDNNYFIADVEGKKSLVTFTSPDTMSWQYVRITPYKQLTGKISDVRRTTIQIAIGILLIGLFISWLLSRFLYVPIRQIVTRMNSLESDKRDSSFAIRQNALRKLIQMHTIHPESQLEKLSRLGIAFDFTKDYRLVYLRIDDFEQLKKQYANDLTVLKFAVMNIATEIASKHFRIETVDCDDDSVLLLLNEPDNGDAGSSESLVLLLKQIQNASLEYVKIGLTIAYSSVSNNAYQLNALFKQTREASLHRYYFGHGIVIEASEIEAYRTKEYVFPSSKEKRLVDSLMSGKTEEAKALYREIVQDTSEYRIQVGRSAIAHLAITLTNILAEIQKNASIQIECTIGTGLPNADSYETLEQLIAYYDDFFDETKTKLQEKRSGKQEDLIRKINDLIERNYHDPNLSLNWIADELAMSTFYVSRVYRQQTLSAIVDVINGTRMEKSKALLLQTDLSVVEITERTGYTNSSYFHRMFKKTFGVTPAEFRKTNANRADIGL